MRNNPSRREGMETLPYNTREAWGEKEEYMKHGKRPTVRQKKLMTEWHLNYENWLVVKDTPDAMTIVHRATGNIRVIQKGE